MKVSESWLREWVNPELSTQDLADQITMAGLEVDAIEPVAPKFNGVIVGEIVSIEQHPDADKLRVCQVAGQGDALTQVVCGAANARAGIKIPFATVGAVLPGDFKIKKAKLRGVESFGMLCAQTELQLGEDDDGLWELAESAPVGSDIREYLSLEDTCIDVDLTPNRSDCLSIKGVAREVGVLNRLMVNEPLIEPVAASLDETFPVELSAKEGCPRYVGRIIRGVDLSKPSPLWMQERLRRAGINSKDIAVDTTNYILLELGQPMHAFDRQKLSGGIEVRWAKAGESIDLLNGQQVELTEGTLVIADENKALAIAGVMGGSESAVSESTQDILLESAFFVPETIAGKARSYGLHTDSSHRFERGVDYRLQEQAIERATRLITEVAGGEVGPVFVTEAEHSILQTRTVTLRKQRIESGLGFAIPENDVMEILTRLGLKELSQDESGWQFEIPSYRFDLEIEADLLEELARIYGYNNLPTTSPTMSMALPMDEETALGIDSVRAHLASRDYQEAVCYTFVDEDIQQGMDPGSTPITLKNPISADMSVMRTSLLQSLVKALQYNVNRQQSRVRLFEAGLQFTSVGEQSSELEGIVQTPMLAALIYGHRQEESWSQKPESVDFYDLKGDLESLIALTAKPEAFSFAASEHPAMHPGQTAAILLEGEVVGHVGALHPVLCKRLELSQVAYAFEMTQSSVATAALPVFETLSRHPEVRRDIAVIVDRSTSVAELEKAVKQSAGESLTKLKVFDVYMGEGIDSNRKSIALGLTFQHLSRTLTDEEITQTQDAVIAHLKATLGAELR